MTSLVISGRSLKTVLLILWLVPALALGAEKQELLEIKNTILNLVDALVEQGVLTGEKAEAIKQAAVEKAREDALAQAPVDEPDPAEQGEQVIRVPYVPEFVKDQIRAEVRAGLRGEVVEDVMRQAKTERWGMPDALPDWTRRFSFEGDLRLRGQGDFYASDNAPYGTAFVDYAEVNDNRGFSGALLNTEEDRERARLRMRLGIKAVVLNDLTANLRLATGSEGSAVSTNQTLDNDFGSYDLLLDRAYLKYTHRDPDGYPWLTLYGGRMANPYLSTDLLWDSDLNFDGLAAKFRYNLAGSDDLFSMQETDKSLFATLGVYSLDEIELDDRDKYLIGAQVGADLMFENQSRFKAAIAYYNFENYSGRRSPLSQPNLYDYTAPGAMQKGNSVFDISNDPDEPFQRFGLAPDFEILNLHAEYDIASFAPIRVILSGDYVQNIGYNANKIRDRIGNGVMFVNSTVFSADPEDEQTRGYYARLTVGWPEVAVRRSWQAWLGYKYLERDAVVDAFTDSDFHLGGTNAKGWILGGRYGLLDNTYLNLSYLSGDEIDGPPLGIDVLQVDIVSEF
jgi:hypothetical protein